jgi:hypothetical protein
MRFVALVIKDKLAAGVDPLYDMVCAEAGSEREAVQLIANHDWPEEYYIGRSVTRVIQIHEADKWNPRKCVGFSGGSPGAGGGAGTESKQEEGHKDGRRTRARTPSPREEDGETGPGTASVPSRPRARVRRST